MTTNTTREALEAAAKFFTVYADKLGPNWRLSPEGCRYEAEFRGHIAALASDAGAVQQTERQAFDAWRRDYFGPLTTNVEISSMWLAWQARAALSAAPVALGAAHDASLDDDHHGCRAILMEVIRLLDAAAPSGDTSSPGDAKGSALFDAWSDEVAQKLLRDTIHDMTVGRKLISLEEGREPDVWQFATGPVGMAIFMAAQRAARGTPPVAQEAAPDKPLWVRWRTDGAFDASTDDVITDSQRRSGAWVQYIPVGAQEAAQAPVGVATTCREDDGRYCVVYRTHDKADAERALLAARAAQPATPAAPEGLTYVTGDPELTELLNLAVDAGAGKANMDTGIRSLDLITRIEARIASAAPQPERVPMTDCHGLDTPERVCFYEQDFYVLSNFSSFGLRWEGHTFPTAEHAYHWEKFRRHVEGEIDDNRFQRMSLARAIEGATSAHEAFKLAEHWRAYRRPDWDEVKVALMRDILRAKVRQHEYVRRKLLATGDRELVENSWRDDFWGWGPNRDGQNMLGKLWMEIRAELRAGIGGATLGSEG